MKCEKCGKEIPANAKFCRFCGAKAETAVVKPKVHFCTACGAKLVENAGFCNKCGAKVGITVEAETPVVIPVKEPVISVSVSDEAPVSKPASASQAKRNTQASEQVKQAANTVLKEVIARLTDGDCTASSTPGEMNLPVTEAQSMFMKLISKGIQGGDGR